MEEIPENENELPSLPEGYASDLDTEEAVQAHLNSGYTSDSDKGAAGVNTPPICEDNEMDDEKIFDAKEDLEEDEVCDECYAPEADVEFIWHQPIQHIREAKIPPVRKRQRDNMPDISRPSPISLHSSREKVTEHLEANPHGLNEMAMNEAIRIMHMRPEDNEGTAPVNSIDRLEPLRAKWFEACSDLMGPIPLHLPPFREINHEINLIDEDLVYGYHMPKCSDALRPQLRDKINRYIAAGWWEMRPVPQATPLLCIHKKTGKLRTVVDARKRNDNTIKDVTPVSRSG
ncbi:hypothetical protein B0H11DRAFT_2264476 [Mycena galericulata]|nr:hypothetical protein B0H11DRAFT_2264476 [Mycena galericulata]